jgi:type II secretory pathway component PulL
VIWWPNALDQTRAEEAGQMILVRYEVLSIKGDKLQGGEEFLNKLPKDMPCLVLVNPTEVGLFAVTPPRVSGNKLKEALPFLVEPYLLNEAEENYVSLWPNLPNHTESVKLAAVLEKTRARSIVRACSQMNFNLLGLSCETLRVQIGSEGGAWLTGEYFVLVDGVDTPLLMPFSQPTLIKVMLQRRLQQIGSKVIQLSIADHEWLINKFFHDTSSLSQIKAVGKNHMESLLNLVKKPLLDTGELRKMGMRPILSQNGVRRLLAPVIGLIVVIVLGLNALAFKAKHVEAILEAQIVNSYAQVLPEIPMVADPLLLIDREIRKLNAGQHTSNLQGLSALLHEVGLAMDQAPFNSMVSFTWTRNTLKIGFNANVSESIQNEALQKLNSRKLEAKWLPASSPNLPVLQIKNEARS